MTVANANMVALPADVVIPAQIPLSGWVGPSISLAGHATADKYYLLFGNLAYKRPTGTGTMQIDAFPILSSSPTGSTLLAPTRTPKCIFGSAANLLSSVQVAACVKVAHSAGSTGATVVLTARATGQADPVTMVALQSAIPVSTIVMVDITPRDGSVAGAAWRDPIINSYAGSNVVIPTTTFSSSAPNISMTLPGSSTKNRLYYVFGQIGYTRPSGSGNIEIRPRMVASASPGVGIDPVTLIGNGAVQVGGDISFGATGSLLGSAYYSCVWTVPKTMSAGSMTTYFGAEASGSGALMLGKASNTNQAITTLLAFEWV